MLVTQVAKHNSIEQVASAKLLGVILHDCMLAFWWASLLN